MTKATWKDIEFTIACKALQQHDERGKIGLSVLTDILKETAKEYGLDAN